MERLSSQDLITLWPDQVGWSQDMGALAILDGGPLTDPGGGVRLDLVRRVVAARLDRAPRLRQVIYTPARGLGRPLWVDARTFDLAAHVRACRLPAPGEEADLLDSIEQLRRRPLDPARPLWQLWLLSGLAEGRVGLYLRVHHVVADGPAAAALLMALLDPGLGPDAGLDVGLDAGLDVGLDAGSDVGLDAGSDVGPGGGPVRAWTPGALPTDRELLADRARRLRDRSRRAVEAVARPRAGFDRIRVGVGGVRHVLAAGQAPRSSLNRSIGADRRLAVVRSDLAAIKKAGRAGGGTVNDVLLAAVTGGLRALLQGRGEQVEGVELRAVVPVALPHSSADRQRGNLLGQIIVPLPIGVADPHQRLRLVAVRTAGAKRQVAPRRMPVLRSRALQRAALWLLARQRAYNVYLANVPGPRAELSLAGARLLEVFPVVPLLGNLTLGVGALSYAGRFAVLAVGDRQLCPDLDVFTAALDGDLQALTARRPQAR
jgi:WS/DGAT/MGAT family acyltransferase